jgi:hypothetical protein
MLFMTQIKFYKRKGDGGGVCVVMLIYSKAHIKEKRQ